MRRTEVLVPALLLGVLLTAGCPGKGGSPAEILERARKGLGAQGKTPADSGKTSKADAKKAAALYLESLSPERRALLVELRMRRIIAETAVSWSSEQEDVLRRLREAEGMGAFDLLRGKLGTLRGYAVESPITGRRGYRHLWLTTRGYKKYVFLATQEAILSFEERGAEATFVFKLKTMDGRRIFDPDGLLTRDGLELYRKIRLKEPAFWKHPDGTVQGTVRPPAP